MPEDTPDNTPPKSLPGSYLNSPKNVATFQEFAGAIQNGNIELAGQRLSELMGISSDKGNSAAAFFANALESNPGMFMQVMQIRTDIEAGNQNKALMSLMKCFGLDGPNAITAIESLRKML